MDVRDYQRLAMRTNDRKGTDRLSKFIGANINVDSYHDVGGLLNGVLGLSGESGEFADMIKKWVFHEKELDELHAKKELGDVLWYIAMICESFDWSMEEIMNLNIDKLMARYPEGFNIDRANHRKVGDV